MAYKNAAPAGKGGRRAQLRSGKATRTTGNGSSPRQSDTSAAPKLGTRIEYREPCCDAAGDATYTKTYNGDDWLIGSRSLRCPGGGRCLSRLGVTLGIGEGATKEQIVSALKARGRRPAGARRSRSLRRSSQRVARPPDGDEPDRCAT